MRRLPGRLRSPEARVRENASVRTVSLTAPAPDRDRGAGLCDALPRGLGSGGRGGDPPALVRAARLDLGSRAQPPDRARVARRRVQARHRAAPARGAAACSSTGRTRHACFRSRSGRCSSPRCGTGADGGTGTSARPIRTSRTRSWPRSASAARSARATSRERAREAAGCGTGSRRRRCSTASGTTVTS